jgi:hypothetical protein
MPNDRRFFSYLPRLSYKKDSGGGSGGGFIATANSVLLAFFICTQWHHF